MKEFLLLWRRDVKETLQSRAFLVTTAIAAAVVILAMALLPRLQALSSARAVSTWAVMSPSPTVTGVFDEALKHLGKEAGETIRFESSTRAAYVIQVLPGSHGVLDGRFHIVIRGTDPEAAPLAKAVINQVVMTTRLAAIGIPLSRLTHALTPPPITVTTVSQGPQVAKAAFTYVLIIFLFVTLVMYGQMLVLNVSAEKASRVSEVLLARVRAEYLLLAKLGGTGVAGLVQVSVVAIVALGMLAGDPTARELVRQWGLQSASVAEWGDLVGAYVIGLLLYGALFAAIGASLSRPEDARGAMGLPAMLLVVGYGLAIAGLKMVHVLWFQVITLIPPLFPLLMFEQASLGLALWWQWLFGVTISLATGMGLIFWAARIYRTNLISESPFHLTKLLRIR